MPETEQKARNRAKELGYPQSAVVKADSERDDSWFIAPQGIESSSAKKAYANCRMRGGDQEYCARIAWNIENK